MNKFVLTAAVLQIALVQAMHGPNNNPSQYTFHQQLSINTVDESVNMNSETESLTFYSSDDDEEENRTLLSSSVLYEGGSVVSTEAITCHGGDQANANDMVLQMDSLVEDDSEDDDDDDDDDNDGHSSMLSTASLRRSRATPIATASGFGDNNNNNNNTPLHNRKKVGTASHSTAHVTNVSTTTNRKSVSSKIRRTKGFCAALSLRGGDLGAEFGKRLMVAALVTLMYEGVLGHFLEFVKIVMQTAPDGTGYVDVVKSITADKGIVGIWDGFLPWGIVQAVAKGGVFGLAHAIASSILLPLAAQDRTTWKLPKQVAMTMAGGIAGGFQGFVLSPTLLLKTRVMTNDVFREKMSLAKTTWLSMTIGADVVSKEGVSALMKGAKVFSTKRVFDWATRYYFSDVCEAIMVARKGGAPLTAVEKITASLLGGTASTISTLPLDVLVAKTQDAKKAGVQVSALNMFKDELKEKGWVGLQKSYMNGFEARLAHVCLTTVVMKTGAPYVYDFLYPATQA